METLYKTDILVILYPNARELQQVIIVDPFDKRLEYYRVDTLDEVKEVLEQHLPFCNEHKELHMGGAYVIEWENLAKTKAVIRKPEDVYDVR